MCLDTVEIAGYLHSVKVSMHGVILWSIGVAPNDASRRDWSVFTVDQNGTNWKNDI